MDANPGVEVLSSRFERLRKSMPGERVCPEAEGQRVCRACERLFGFLKEGGRSFKSVIEEREGTRVQG